MQEFFLLKYAKFWKFSLSSFLACCPVLRRESQRQAKAKRGAKTLKFYPHAQKT
jgi:hypothetical protein